MLTVNLHTGHLPTVEKFIADMVFSGYQLGSRHPSFSMPSQIIKFHRPATAAPLLTDWFAVAS